MEGMLAMSDINCIKFLRNHKSHSINRIAKNLDLNWRTVKKYADSAQLPSETIRPKRGMMYGTKWGEMVEDWLIEDQMLQKKLRRTNKKIYETLVANGFEGSYRTVCNFIKSWHMTSEEENDTRHERLQHPPGEAQVDFGTMEVVKDSHAVDVKCLVMSLPFSNRTAAVALPAENQECFLTGLKMLFEEIGGVPQQLRIDNLPAAVIQPRTTREEAIYTDAFLQFMAHYGFQVQSCNPYSGNEKGSVENKVGYVRYNFLVPAPVMHDYDSMNRQLAVSLRDDMERVHYEKHVLIRELFEEEQRHLLRLPQEDFPVFKEELFKVNKYGEITIDKTKVLIPSGSRHGQVRAILRWDSMKILSLYGEILYEEKRPYMMTKRALPWENIISTWHKKPRSFGHSRYSEYLPGRIKEYLGVPNLLVRQERLGWIRAKLALYPILEINERLYELLSEDDDPAVVEDHPYDVDWSKYDSLNRPWGEGGTA
jgi:transposase